MHLQWRWFTIRIGVKTTGDIFVRRDYLKIVGIVYEEEEEKNCVAKFLETCRKFLGGRKRRRKSRRRMEKIIFSIFDTWTELIKLRIEWANTENNAREFAEIFIK